MCDRLTKADSAVAGFSVTEGWCWATSPTSKCEMVEDLRIGTDALLASELLCATAGMSRLAKQSGTARSPLICLSRTGCYRRPSS